jgi:hypothetical protein
MSIRAAQWNRLRDGTDPRLRADSVEFVPGTHDREPVCLVGVVHDHPASVARVRKVVSALSPDVLALELPPSGVGLFERFAADGASPPSRGGEMSAAIQATPESRVVGIDAPSRRFAGVLGATLQEGDVDRETIAGITRRTTSLTAHAVACWAAGTAKRLSLPFPDVAPQLEYDCEHADPPRVQAEHEAGHVRRSQSFLAAVDAPAGQERFGELRESAMASRVRSLRTDESVVAVVGFDHLEAVADRLRDR